MLVTVVPFARLRELLGFSRRSLALSERASVGDAWTALAAEFPAIRDLRDATRIACNGTLVGPTRPLCDGDELALLPPVGGG